MNNPDETSTRGLAMEATKNWGKEDINENIFIGRLSCSPSITSADNIVLGDPKPPSFIRRILSFLRSILFMGG